jgi:hypothetical protein
MAERNRGWWWFRIKSGKGLRTTFIKFFGLYLIVPICTISTSVATVMTDVFQKNGIMVSRKLAKIMRIFANTGHIINQGVIYWPERIGLVIPTLWSGHNFGQNLFVMQQINPAIVHVPTV